MIMWTLDVSRRNYHYRPNWPLWGCIVLALATWAGVLWMGVK